MFSFLFLFHFICPPCSSIFSTRREGKKAYACIEITIDSLIFLDLRKTYQKTEQTCSTSWKCRLVQYRQSTLLLLLLFLFFISHLLLFSVFLYLVDRLSYSPSQQFSFLASETDPVRLGIDLSIARCPRIFLGRSRHTCFYSAFLD